MTRPGFFVVRDVAEAGKVVVEAWLIGAEADVERRANETADRLTRELGVAHHVEQLSVHI